MRSDRRRFRPDFFRVVLACERLEEREVPAAGALDPAFGAAGQVWDARVQGDLRAVALQSDGKTLAAGTTRTAVGSSAVVVRLNADGTADKTFDGDGLLTLDFGMHRSAAAALAVQSNGKVVIAGDDGGDGIHVARFNADGSLDRTFNGAGQAFTAFAGLGVTATGLALQADGKVVVVGRGTPTSNQPSRVVLARFNSEGSLDRSFDGDGQAITSLGATAVSANAVAVQPDGKLVVGGTVVSGTTAALALFRYTSSGVLDNGFGAGGSARTAFRYAPSAGAELAVQSDGKIVLAGGGDVTRYNGDGTLDTRFGTGGATDTTLNNLAGVVVQADGTILLAGTSSVGPNPTNIALVRVTSSGLLDRTFDGDGRAIADLGGRDSATGLAVAPGRAVIAAASTNAAGVNGGALARILTTDAPVASPVGTTTVLSASGSATTSQPVSLTAKVSATAGSALPTGTVTFKDGSATLGTIAISSGQATISTAGLSVGSHQITAVFNGSTGLAASTSTPLALTVTTSTTTTKGTTTVLSASTNPIADRPITLTATVTVIGGGAAVGSVMFKDGARLLGTSAIVAGRALFSTSGLGAGMHTLTAVYAGATGLTGSTSAVLSLSLGSTNKPTTTTVSASANPTAGRPVTLTAAVIASGVSATGTVTFRDGTTTLGSAPLSGGVATLTTSALVAGAHQITAAYGGAAGLGSSTSAALALTVSPAVVQVATTTTIDQSLGATVYGQPVGFVASVRSSVAGAPTPTGTVTFKDGAVILATLPLTDGSATIALSALAVGTHSLSAVYNGDIRSAPSTSAAATLPVSKASTIVDFDLSPDVVVAGGTLTLKATVRALAPSGAVPTGQIVIKADSLVLGTLTLDRTGSMSLTIANPLASKQHWITVGYYGNESFSPDANGDLLTVL